MLTVLLAIVGFLLAMVPLVVVHEWGHYWVAKKLGVKIRRFSIGFGKPLWLRRFGPDQTEWVIAALPLGGYVSMVDEREGEVAPEDLPRAFNRQPVWKRILIVLAGPMANLLLAFVIFSGMLMLGVQQLRPEVMGLRAHSIAEQAGFRDGERIVSVAGESVASWSDVDIYLLIEALGQRSAEVTTQGPGGETRRLVLDFSNYDRRKLGPNLSWTLGFVPRPNLPEARLGGVGEKTAAERAGLRADDVIRAVDGVPVAGWDAMTRIVMASPGKPLVLRVQRGSQLLDLRAVPDTVLEDGRRIGRLGVGAVVDMQRLESLIFLQRMGPLEAAEHSWKQGVAMTRLTLEMMGRMALGQVSTDNLSGPIGIAQMAGGMISAGMPFFVLFISVMSLSLGLLNLLPIPVLDGGHLVYYLAEAVLGRPLSERTLLWAQRLGLLLLGLLTLLAFYNDILRLIPSR